MKKDNKKQRAYAVRSISEAQRKRRRNLVYAISSAIFCLVLVMFIFGDASLSDFFWTTGVTMATVAPAAVNITGDAPPAQTAGKLIKAKIWFITAEQYDDDQAFPSRNGREIGNIPLKAGEYWHYIKTQAITNPDAMIGGKLSDIGGSFDNEIKLLLAGVSDEVLTLVENHLGKGFYIVFEVCATGKKYLGGSGCKAMILQQPEGGFLNDKSCITLSFKNECGQLFSTYVGNTPTIVAADVAAGVSFALTSNPQYKFAEDTGGALCKTVTGIVESDVNRVITVLGGGGTNPTHLVQDAAGNILLIGGVAWIGDLGRQISFKIFKDGNTSFKLIEIAGTRT